MDLGSFSTLGIKKWHFRMPFFWFARHGRALTGASPEHAQVVGNVGILSLKTTEKAIVKNTIAFLYI